MRWRDFGALVSFYLWHRLHGRQGAVITFNKIRIEPGTSIRAQAVAEGLIGADDPLLPRQPSEMLGMFYHQPRPGFIDWSYDLLLMLKRCHLANSP
jgi:hypothetical protein